MKRLLILLACSASLNASQGGQYPEGFQSKDHNALEETGKRVSIIKQLDKHDADRGRGDSKYMTEEEMIASLKPVHELLLYPIVERKDHRFAPKKDAKK